MNIEICLLKCACPAMSGDSVATKFSGSTVCWQMPTYSFVWHTNVSFTLRPLISWWEANSHKTIWRLSCWWQQKDILLTLNADVFTDKVLLRKFCYKHRKSGVFLQTALGRWCQVKVYTVKQALGPQKEKERERERGRWRREEVEEEEEKGSMGRGHQLQQGWEERRKLGEWRRRRQRRVQDNRSWEGGEGETDSTISIESQVRPFWLFNRNANNILFVDGQHLLMYIQRGQIRSNTLVPE